MHNMKSHRLAELLSYVNEMPTEHPDSETLAEIASEKVWGEPVDDLYLDELTHIRACRQCMSALAKLEQMTDQALGNMASAAAQVSPEEVYARFLLSKLDAPAAESIDWLVPLLQKLPAYMSQIPTSVTDLNLILARVGGVPPTWRELVPRAMLQAPAELTTFLGTQARRVWKTPLGSRVNGEKVSLFSKVAGPGYSMAEAPEAYEADDQEWVLTCQTLEQPLAVQIDVRALSTSIPGCTLMVSLKPVAGAAVPPIAIEVEYSGQYVKGLPDAEGDVTFKDIPKAALTDLTIRIRMART